MKQSNLTLNDATRQAAKLAGKYSIADNVSALVYVDGDKVFVRSSRDVRPENTIIYCVAQRWNDKSVELRFSGAQSEWVTL